MRAVAVLAVVASHAGMPGFSGGYVGVDIFFVISGYLITGILLEQHRQGTYSIADFYERRVRRILPALFAMLAVCLLLGWFLVPPPQYERLGASTAAATLFVSNIWFMSQTAGYFDVSAEYDLLLHTWSLAVEEQFYIVWPLLMAAIFRFGRGRLVLVLSLLSAASFAYAAILTSTNPKHAFFLVTSRAWELGAGALLAVVSIPSVKRQWVAELVSVAAAAILAAVIMIYDAETPFPGLAALPPVLAAAMLIGIGTGHSTMVGRLLGSRIAVGIGLISYSLYLWHWPALVLARLHVGSLAIGPYYAALAVGGSLVLAWVSWRFIERPFRAARHRDDPGLRKRVFAIAAVGLAITATSGMVVSRAEGFWSRAGDMRDDYERAVNRSDAELRCWDLTPEKRCPIGASGKESPTVLLWGDSHAAAMIPGFDLWLRQKGISGEAAIPQACAPLLGVERQGNQKSEGKCLAFNQRTLQHVLQSPNLQTVYVVGRWPLSMSGMRPDGEDGPPVVMRGVETEDVSGNAALVELGLDRLLSQLSSSDRTVYLLADVPELGTGPAQRMLSARFYGLPFAGGPSRMAVEQRQSQSRAMLQRLAARYGAHFVDVPAIVCAETCPVVSGGNALYRDENHLSQSGSRLLVPQILDVAQGLEAAR